MKYKITYSEGMIINKSIEIEADNVYSAVAKFQLLNPNAVFIEVREVGEKIEREE